MAGTDWAVHVDSAVRGVLNRARVLLRPPVGPDYVVPSPPDPREQWLRQLDRVRDALEQARTVIACDGFTSGAWFTVYTPTGSLRLVAAPEASALCDARRNVVSSCVVGTLLRLADDPDRVASLNDVWRCVDELSEAAHEQQGHVSYPAGRAWPPAERHARLRALTAWNDTPGRTQAQVVDLFDRAISRTIVAACR